MDDNNLLIIVLAFVVGFMLQGMMKNMCGGRLVEGYNHPCFETVPGTCGTNNIQGIPEGTSSSAHWDEESAARENPSNNRFSYCYLRGDCVANVQRETDNGHMIYHVNDQCNVTQSDNSSDMVHLKKPGCNIGSGS